MLQSLYEVVFPLIVAEFCSYLGTADPCFSDHEALGMALFF